MKRLTSLQEIQVSYKSSYGHESIKGSSTAADILRKAYNISEANMALKEYFYVLLLSQAHKVIGFYQVSSGGMTSTVADAKLVFSIALKCLAASIVICHNHPSGNLKPSEADKRLTKKFLEASKVLDIAMLDHIILTEDWYTSFSDEGLL